MESQPVESGVPAALQIMSEEKPVDLYKLGCRDWNLILVDLLTYNYNT